MRLLVWLAGTGVTLAVLEIGAWFTMFWWVYVIVAVVWLIIAFAPSEAVGSAIEEFIDALI